MYFVWVSHQSLLLCSDVQNARVCSFTPTSSTWCTSLACTHFYLCCTAGIRFPSRIMMIIPCLQTQILSHILANRYGTKCPQELRCRILKKSTINEHKITINITVYWFLLVLIQITLITVSTRDFFILRPDHYIYIKITIVISVCNLRSKY